MAVNSEIWTGYCDTAGLFIATDEDAFCIETYSGMRFPVRNPKPDFIRLDDVAHSLAMQCRYGGHVLRFLSVAEHSVMVADVLAAAGEKPDVVKLGLLHDAAEAYLTDLCRPVKMLLPYYSQLEDRVMKAVRQRFGLVVSPADEVTVKTADNAVLRAEATVVTRSGGRHWNWGSVVAADVEVRCLPPEDAERLFLERCGELGIK